MLTVGSVWRRWDLHVHTPGTNLNDQFGGWDAYLTAIESDQSVEALGITDYFTIDNYEIAREHHLNGRMANIGLLLPNVEFRISPQNEKAAAVNVHLLISPDDPHHIELIRDALTRLSFEYEGNQYSCTREALIRLGRACDGQQLAEQAALTAGCTQFKPSFTDFRDWYRSQRWLRENSIVAIAAGKDGVSGFSMEGGFAATRKEMTRFTDAVFSGRPKEREFWLGQLTEQDRTTMLALGGPKPCFHGSDAHDDARLLKPDDGRYTWIKADLSFDGLRQTLFEPDERVWIGQSAPQPRDRARVISAVQIKDPHGWFPKAEMPLNSGLVAIVGQKGAGKSAIAELIAFGAGASLGVESSFFHRAAAALRGVQVTLKWADGGVSERTIGEAGIGAPKVRYLSQAFVERLCNEQQGGSALVTEIEKLVFSYLDPTETLNAADFTELRTIKTASVQERRSSLAANVSRTVDEIETLRESHSRLAELRQRQGVLHAEQEGLKLQIAPSEDQKAADLQAQLAAVLQELTSVQARIAAERSNLEKLDLIETRYLGFKQIAEQFYANVVGDLKALGFSESEQAAFRPVFSENADRSLNRVRLRITETIRTLLGDPKAPAPGTEAALTAHVQKLSQIELADKQKQAQVLATQRRLSEIAAELARIDAEIRTIEGPEAERLKALRAALVEDYLAWFALLAEERTILDELYSPIATRLSKGTAQERLLEFYVRTLVDVDAWIERGASLFDQRRALPYGSLEEIAGAARDALVPAWLSGEPEKIRGAMRTFMQAFNLEGGASYLRSGTGVKDLQHWLLSLEHITLSYGLRYNGTELSKLSPGTKGIVLLILYLGMDRNDTRPLIVDQPDENLDSESIYGLLTAYFRQSKRERQIVLVTHDPNLVVNTDAEQVVVATCSRGEGAKPCFTYSAGSLEDNRSEEERIRDSVCRILEGGKAAFAAREKRYSDAA